MQVMWALEQCQCKMTIQSLMSQALNDKNKGLSTYEKECMAVLLAVDI